MTPVLDNIIGELKFCTARQSGGMRVTVNGFRERIERIGVPHVTFSVQSVQKIR